MANITMTVVREQDDCQFFADMIPGGGGKFVMTAKPVVFSRRSIFTQDSGDPMLILPLENAKKMAEEILKL